MTRPPLPYNYTCVADGTPFESEIFRIGIIVYAVLITLLVTNNIARRTSGCKDVGITQI